MDVHKALQELYQEKYRLDAAITQLESMQQASVHQVSTPARRKRFNPAQREATTRRKTEEWEERKTATA